MRVAVLHNLVPPDAPAAEQDVLVQADAVARALRELGCEPAAVPLSLDLRRVFQDLDVLRPDVVFNLVESFGGSDRLMYLAAGMLDALGYRYTGSPTEALFSLSSKLAAKRRIRALRLPTPDWISTESDPAHPDAGGQRRAAGGVCYVLKPVYEHASFGLTSDSVVRAEATESLHARLAERGRQLGTPVFAERYVEGREFNLSLLDGAGGPEVLPPAEIDFSAFPPGMPRIVDERAKWESDSFEYRNTPRRFDFRRCDEPLLAELANLARCCWHLFGLRGYARVDFRVDAGGKPWILEVNPNPCLSPDAGFAAASSRAGIPFSQVIRRILDAAVGGGTLTAPIARQPAATATSSSGTPDGVLRSTRD